MPEEASEFNGLVLFRGAAARSSGPGQPPATAGRIETVSPSAIGVSSEPR